MNKTLRIIIVLAVVTAAALALVARQRTTSRSPAAEAATVAAPSNPDAHAVHANAKLPRMVDLGAGKCIPCRMMKPILDDLKANYADRFITEFIDVWENPDAGKPYGIRAIPTQIFFDAEGKELFRHEGFYGKEDIMAKWTELGVDVGSQSSGTTTGGATN